MSNWRKWPWATILAAVSGAAGVVGTIVTPIWGADAGSRAQAILQGLSALLTFMSGFAVTHVAVTTAKLKAAARFGK